MACLWPAHPAPDRARAAVRLGERGHGGRLRRAEGHPGRQGESYGWCRRRRRGRDRVPPQRLLSPLQMPQHMHRIKRLGERDKAGAGTLSEDIGRE